MNVSQRLGRVVTDPGPHTDRQTDIETQTYARFYQLGITRETQLIPGIRNNSVLSTPDLGLP